MLSGSLESTRRKEEERKRMRIRVPELRENEQGEGMSIVELQFQGYP
jgi:hypothetical protein